MSMGRKRIGQCTSLFPKVKVSHVPTPPCMLFSTGASQTFPWEPSASSMVQPTIMVSARSSVVPCTGFEVQIWYIELVKEQTCAPGDFESTIVSLFPWAPRC